MRFSTVFISSAFVLASMSVALPIERGNILVARLADSGFLAEVEGRAYDEEPELYARARVPNRHHKDRDYDTRIIDDDDAPFFPGVGDPRPYPHQPTASTKGHPRLR